MKRSQGFAAIADASAQILILGSLPGQRSIDEQQYYAHPRNAFWRIMQDVFAIDGSYERRCMDLKRHRIALWDVLQASVRPGSLDADIQEATAVCNPFEDFFDRHQHIQRILFNGKTAEVLYRKHALIDRHEDRQMIGLPSTSPAYAAMPYAEKLERWHKALLIN